ncbi:unnamed protein product [marine sediment metagenome]|uniref:Uncharacterized protein n=1 Tax=marine sediment metagenome TaxID=412755 RepID=X1RDH4_9ZZZZ
MNETIKTLDKPARAGKHWKPDELEFHVSDAKPRSGIDTSLIF